MRRGRYPLDFMRGVVLDQKVALGNKNAVDRYVGVGLGSSIDVAAIVEANVVEVREAELVL